ncbi:putative nucleic acid-binding protein [Pseudomonas nitritireducens]|uniref:Putative nucleic acid-binding protein n=1 Tax=Pseudomonas nitroreducens TaxID=46680 RepID=A0A7W7KG48_PSENT|nr:VapC toxin family PIN domain ribonuclease [Pseudomonas nitritireducens]MBB4861658.1 putative nucleic acid-binding protein [Pseudomonas nitritireducens]
MSVLVDTSVWAAHFREQNDTLAVLLTFDQVVTHPVVIGELACMELPDRSTTLSDLKALRQANQATRIEVEQFIRIHGLEGKGCDLNEVTLLCSTILTPGAVYWTHRTHLAELAKSLGVYYRA